MLDSRLTVQQIQALEQLAEKAKVHGVEIGIRDFCLRFEDEHRPGRGHYVHLAYVDGDYAVSAGIDVDGRDTGLFVASSLAACDPGMETPCDDCQAADDE